MEVTETPPPARPIRQEQEDASPEVTAVAPGVLRFQLPIELPGLGHVNTYALEDGDGVTLVDPGLPGETSWRALNDRLATAGIPLRRVHTVVVTHSHPDHYGGTTQIVEETGARVVTSRHFRNWWDPRDIDEVLDDADDVPEPVIAEIPFARRSPWGGEAPGPTPEQQALMAADPAEARRWLVVPRPTHRLSDTDPVTLAGRTWVGLHTPGHTEDHLCLYDPEAGILLSGDHVLPSITPHISGLLSEDAIATYVRSLQRVAALPGITTVLPAHGHPFSDLAGRVAEIEEHHDERLDRVAEISASLGWASVEAFSQQLFAPRSWGPMAESETFAHLEHLRVVGRAEQREEGGKLLYLIA